MSYRLCKTAGIVVLLWFACSLRAYGATVVVKASVVDGFNPTVVNIFTGDKVEWDAKGGTINITGTGIGGGVTSTNSDGSINTNSSGNTIDSSIGPKSFSFQFTTAGSFPYNDTINPNLLDHTGLVVVTAAPATISISSPANGAVFSPNVPIAFTADVSALSNSSIANIQFLVNGKLIGFQTGTNNSVSFYESALGQYALTVVATNSSGVASTSAPVDITVAAPVAMVSPTNDEFFYTNTLVTLSAGLTNLSPAPLGVRYLVNGTAITNRVDSLFEVTNFNELVSGTYTVAAVVTNSLGFATTSAPVTIFIGESVGILSPTNNSVFFTNSQINLNPDLSHVSLLPQSVSFILVGNVYSNVNASPFSVNFSTNTVGTYTLQVAITNSAGIASTSAPVSFSVVSSLPPAGVISPVAGANYSFNSPILLMPNLAVATVVPTNVAFFINGLLYSNRSVAPFSVNFTTNALGDYTFNAVLMYGGGINSTSVPVSFSVTPVGFSSFIQPGSVALANGMMEFAFPSATTGSYAIQSSPDLSPGSWVTVTNITGTGGSVSFSAPQSPSNAFFRWLYTP